jgi:phytoene dehydrogenase-like protein
MSTSALVIGGGLAGLTAALELADHGLRVAVLEASLRAGGKVGSDPDRDGVPRDHGIHIFPGWYVNTRRVLQRVGALGSLVDHHRVAYLRPKQFPRLRHLVEPRSFASGLANTFRGPLPWWQAMLYQYFMLDLAGRSLDEDHVLDRISQIGLLNSRWYRDEAVAAFLESNIMHAASVYADEISARSWQRIVRYWLRTPSPFFSTVVGDLQTRVVAPLLRALAARGVTVATDRRVVELRVDGGAVVGARWTASAGDGGVAAADRYLLCTPLETIQSLVQDAVYGAAPDLGSVKRLASQPMSGFFVPLPVKIPHLGSDFVFLMDSEHSLSVIDVTPDGAATTLACVVGDFGPLRSLSDAAITDLLLAELARFLPLPAPPPGGRLTAHLHRNVDQPLFINTCGSWADRPGSRTALRNLYLAGDYCQNAIDLACMEGAVCSALDAARAVLADSGVASDGAARPPERSRLRYRWLTLAAAPAMVVPWLRARLARRHTRA